MARPSHREKILTEGLRVLHTRGFSGASVRDITAAAGVPLGSFTNHFTSKEAFSLEVLDRYFDRSRVLIGETLRNDSLQPLARLRGYIEAAETTLSHDGLWNGCLIGNFCAEASEHSDLIRQRLVEILTEMEQSVADCLRAAVDAGALSPETDCADLAGFVIASLQGAFLEAKAERSPDPMARFKRVLFSTVLRGNEA